MAREKQNYRDTLSFLVNEKGVPMVMSKKRAAVILGVSRTKLNEMIADGNIAVDNNKITVGSIARYLCG